MFLVASPAQYCFPWGEALVSPSLQSILPDLAKQVLPALPWRWALMLPTPPVPLDLG